MFGKALFCNVFMRMFMWLIKSFVCGKPRGATVIGNVV